ncbi:MAG: type II secretion system protein, partial [Gammaproteobacteria bacterium]
TRRPRGFTLIELLVTLAILALLGALVVPTAQIALQRRHEQELRTALREIRNALDDYKRASGEGRVPNTLDGSGYPPNLAMLTRGVPDQRSATPRKIYFLRAMPRDPFAEDPEAADIDTWAPRAYQSDPDDPKPGEDVYDVHSKSEKVGLNGIPYKRW